MCVMNHNWLATKQRLHAQSVAGIAAIQFRQGTEFDNVGNSTMLHRLVSVALSCVIYEINRYIGRKLLFYPPLHSMSALGD